MSVITGCNGKASNSANCITSADNDCKEQSFLIDYYQQPIGTFSLLGETLSITATGKNNRKKQFSSVTGLNYEYGFKYKVKGVTIDQVETAPILEMTTLIEKIFTPHPFQLELALPSLMAKKLGSNTYSIHGDLLKVVVTDDSLVKVFDTFINEGLDLRRTPSSTHDINYPKIKLFMEFDADIASESITQINLVKIVKIAKPTNQ